MGGFRDISMVGKIGIASTALCLLIYLIGFCTNYWHVSYEQSTISSEQLKHHSGLWYVCNPICLSRGQQYATGADQATQAIECVGLAFVVVGFILAVVRTLSESVGQVSSVALGAVGCIFTGVFFYLIGLIIWAVYYRPPPQAFSFILAFLATLLHIPGAIFLLLDAREEN